MFEKIKKAGSLYNIIANIILGFIVIGLVYFLTASAWTLVVAITLGIAVHWSSILLQKEKQGNFFGMFGFYLGSVIGIMLVGLLFL